ncbi:metallophosphoesterase family protein [Rhizobium leguminosarum]|uniref:metallophosphoesterase family protein n=1 Tax=Rhizobium leguminosarum TaxID=384 RepID=UPI00102F4F38|nr:metallophosphoesterase [Rhizobium leguminosarum]TAY14031.1 hypothetical protein ELH96_20775 [Rhizobium leguminosarum]
MERYTIMLKSLAPYVLLVVALTTLTALRIYKKKFKGPGEQNFFDSTFAWLTTGVCASALLGLWSIFLSDPNKVGVLLAGFGALFSSLFYFLLSIFNWAFFMPNIVLSEVASQKSGAHIGFLKFGKQRVEITHISDTHLPENLTMEGGIAVEEAKRLTVDALQVGVERQLVSSASYIFHTGDVTDTGSEKEWQIFRELCDYARVDRTRLFVVPGNHDLRLETENFGPMNKLTIGFEQRCATFVEQFLKDCPPSWCYLSQGKLRSVRHIFDDVGLSYLEVYKEYPPFQKVVPAKPTSIILVKPSEQMKEFADQVENRLTWPLPQSLLVSDLVKRLYPMIFLHTSKFLILGLNSSSEGSRSIVDGATGYIDPEQMDRLRAILALCASARVLILLHHHVGVPERIEKLFASRNQTYQLRYLQLQNAQSLLDCFKGRNVTIFHGHKHVGYQAETANVVVVSAPSVTYGDIAGDQPTVGEYFVVKATSSIVRRS